MEEIKFGQFGLSLVLSVIVGIIFKILGGDSISERIKVGVMVGVGVALGLVAIPYGGMPWTVVNVVNGLLVGIMAAAGASGIYSWVNKGFAGASASKTTSMIAYLLVLVWLPGLTGMNGCATTNLSLSHEQGFLWASNVYSAQYDLYLDRALKKDLPIETKIAVKKDPFLIKQEMIRTDLTDNQKRILADRKKLLTFVYKPLLAWGDYVRKGTISPQYTDIAEIEAIVTEAVNKLLKTEGEQW